MNRNPITIDDPKLTAYALGELDAQERTEIERRLADDPVARRQVEETMAFAVRLGGALRAEEAPELRAEHLRAIRAAASKERKVIAFPAWLTRAALPLAAAATVALAAWLGFPAFRGAPQPSGGQVAQAKTERKSDAWVERAAELAEKDLNRQVAIAPAPPQSTTPIPPSASAMPSSHPDEKPIAAVKSRELTPVAPAVSKAATSVAAGRELTHTPSSGPQPTAQTAVRENVGKLVASAKPPAAPTLPQPGGGGVHRGALTLGFEPQSTAGGAMGAQPPQTARGGGAMSRGQPSAVAGGAMVAGKADLSSGGGGLAGRDDAVAAGGGGLAAATADVAQAGGGLGVQAQVAVKSFERGWVNNKEVAAPSRPMEFGALPRLESRGVPPVPACRIAGDYDVRIIPSPAPPPLELLIVGKPARPFDTETYDKIEDNAFLDARQNPLSTFSIDVDTAAYSNVRRFLRCGQLPPAGAVRIEEMLNYFEYAYPPAPEGKPFSVSVDVVDAPWNTKHRLARIGLKGREIDPANRPPCNLVFLLDVSGSMNQPNKLPLVKEAIKILLEQLAEKDRVAIVTYAGASGLALPSTPAGRKRDIREAIDELRPGGSTNGEAGIQLAYDIAKANFIAGGANRVILATDGDFNIGVTSRDELLRLIEEKAKSGVFLTVLGFGMGNIKDATLEQLADKGNGTYGYIDDEREAKRLFARHATGSLVTIAKDVKIQVEFNPARVGAYRLIGYENRALRAEDFNDDKKDAGEIGSGHTVTALYELIPPGEAVDLPKVDELKYQQSPKAAPAAKSDELMTVKLRYKRPDGDTSDKIEVPVTTEGGAIDAASADLKFSAAVAEFGMLLRNSPHKGTSDWPSVLALAAAGRGADSHGDRAEFIDLVRAAEKLNDQR